MHIEKEFLSALSSLQNVIKVLIAVSGGADSMAMLHLCAKYFPLKNIPFCAVTVNHNIRPESVSASDAELVLSYCTHAGISCLNKKVDPGYIKEKAGQRKKGIEEAARYIRYSLFEQTALECGASHIFLGHNKNDQLETVLQRFFQGSSTSLYGIIQERKPYFRPLLQVERREIEQYCSLNAVPYCIDSTNSDNSYFRNRIRNEVIPFLNKTISGWDTGIISGSRKALYDADFFESQLKDEWYAESNSCVSISAERFCSMHRAVRIRQLYKALIILGINQRIPFSVIDSAAGGASCGTLSAAFIWKNNKLYIKKESSTGKSEYFFGIIEDECEIVLDDTIICVSSASESYETQNMKQMCLKGCLPLKVLYEHGRLNVEQISQFYHLKPVFVYCIRNSNEQ